jgi:hypothetical protein
MSHYDDYDDEDYRTPEARWEDEIGCLFPGECCMPGEHHKSECHTAEHLEAYEQDDQSL